MLMVWLWLSLASASDRIALIEYETIKINGYDVEQRYWAVPETVKIPLLANRKSVEQAVEGMLYDAVASQKLDREKVYQSPEYQTFLENIKKKMKVPEMVQGRDGLLAWFKGKGEARGFELEENKWLAQYWLQQQLSKATTDEKLEQIALEHYLVHGGEMANWEQAKQAYIDKVKADVLKRKRLEIWSRLVDRSKIKTYPDHFEAFLQQHAPKPSTVEGSLSPKP